MLSRYIRKKPTHDTMMLGDGRFEYHVKIPLNFWNWQRKSIRHWVLKRFPKAEWIGNGVPRSQPHAKYMSF